MADDPTVAREVFGVYFEQASQYVDILTSRGIDWGLLGPRESDRVWDRHVLNSLALSQLLPEGVSVVDVGSGAGLPGVPLAIARPDLRVTLLEPLLRRYTFLVQAVDELGLAGRVTVLRGRAEETRSTFDVVACRAVAPLERLMGWTAGLFLPAGQLLALKGSSAEREVVEAAGALRAPRLTAEVLTVRAHPDADPTNVIRVRRA